MVRGLAAAASRIVSNLRRRQVERSVAVLRLDQASLPSPRRRPSPVERCAQAIAVGRLSESHAHDDDVRLASESRHVRPAVEDGDLGHALGAKPELGDSAPAPLIVFDNNGMTSGA